MNICIFGASSDRIDQAYFTAAYELGSLIGREGYRLIFGGGQEGLMGACARGVLQAGGKVLGIAPRFFDEPGILMKDTCDFLFTDTMSERKARMEDEADAFIALPGGIGTYEEFFEVLTLKQLGRHSKPMALLNTLGYYDALHALLNMTAESGFMTENVMRLFALCSDPAEALKHVSTGSQVPIGSPSLSSYSR